MLLQRLKETVQGVFRLKALTYYGLQYYPFDPYLKIKCYEIKLNIYQMFKWIFKVDIKRCRSILR